MDNGRMENSMGKVNILVKMEQSKKGSFTMGNISERRVGRFSMLMRIMIHIKCYDGGLNMKLDHVNFSSTSKNQHFHFNNCIL